jgi:ankyrin repeat protein
MAKPRLQSPFPNIKADANIRNKRRLPVYHQSRIAAAAEEVKIDIVKPLLERREEISSRNASNQTSLDGAGAKGKVDFVRLLIER